MWVSTRREIIGSEDIIKNRLLPILNQEEGEANNNISRKYVDCHIINQFWRFFEGYIAEVQHDSYKSFSSNK